MRHQASQRFWSCYSELPLDIRELADKSYRMLTTDPRHPSLHLKRVGSLWSARITDQYRVLGTSIPGGILWVWIGPHREYERLVRTKLSEPAICEYA